MILLKRTGLPQIVDRKSSRQVKGPTLLKITLTKFSHLSKPSTTFFGKVKGPTTFFITRPNRRHYKSISINRKIYFIITHGSGGTGGRAPANKCSCAMHLLK